MCFVEYQLFEHDMRPFPTPQTPPIKTAGMLMVEVRVDITEEAVEERGTAVTK